MRIEPEISSASIRLRGHFNPAILALDWLARELGIDKAGKTVKVVYPEVGAIDGEWFSFQATKERFQIDTSEAPFIRIADLTGRMFGNLLVHTPIWQLIITRIVHFSVGTETIQHQIGRTLAPIEPWGFWGKEIEHAPKRSGLAQLAMGLEVNEPPFDRDVTATVQPSMKIRRGTAIHMEVQDRYTLPSEEKTIGCQEIIAKLNSGFDMSL